MEPSVSSRAMAPVYRRVTYKLYPSPAQAAEMERLCDLHRGLYNAALQERADAWRLARKSVGYAEQCRSLTRVRRENPEYLGVNAQSLQVTLKRLDLAFRAFFRRVKAGGTPGFPRFKGRDRFPGFGFKSHGDGFRFAPGAAGGTAGCGSPGSARCRPGARPGRRAGSWAATCGARRTAGTCRWCWRARPSGSGRATREAGLDWGVETFATLAYSPDEFADVPERPPAGRGAGRGSRPSRGCSRRPCAASARSEPPGTAG